MIAIIDYDAGNVKSVQKALAYLHEDTILTRDPKQLLAAEKVILPGVGAFGDAMGKLKEYGLFEGFSREPYVYFVHSYYLKAEEDIVTARTEYGVSIDASVEKGNLFACQFHPEKSSEAGLKILENFVRLGREGN